MTTAYDPHADWAREDRELARVSALHTAHRAAHVELRILLNRGLDYTDRFADVADQLATIERELAGVAAAR